MKKNHPFSPIYNKESKVLILGSLPSIESVKKGYYYMHPQNRFWKVLSVIFQKDVYSMGIKQKNEFILEHHLSLYDVIASCTIEQSSDASIKDVFYTDIKEIINHTQITKILLNGKTAYQLFLKKYPEYQDMALSMPSTSSANAKFRLEDLVEIWRAALLDTIDLL